MGKNNAPVIEIINLTKRFLRPNGKEIKPIDDISLAVEQEELVALLGASGCGKTTLLRCVAGLEKADSGTIIINGETVFDAKKDIFVPANKRRLSMVFQSFALWPHMTVEKNIAYPMEARGVDRRKIAESVREVVRLVNIEGIESQYPGRISGGQQQRVALARALVGDTNVLLFDEPLSSVDAQVRAQLRFELKRMQTKIRFAGLFVTHDQSEAMELGQRVAVLRSGKVEALGAPRAIYDHPSNEYVARFIGVANLLKGVVRDNQSAHLLINTPLGDFEAVVPPDGAIGGGTAVTIVLRPERARISASRGKSRTNGFEAKVVSTIFCGSYIEYVLSRDGFDLRVWMSREALEPEFAEGATVWVSTEPSALHVISEGAAANVVATPRITEPSGAM